jgi:hypothetical protein
MCTNCRETVQQIEFRCGHLSFNTTGAETLQFHPKTCAWCAAGGRPLTFQMSCNHLRRNVAQSSPPDTTPSPSSSCHLALTVYKTTTPVFTAAARAASLGV